MDVNVPPDNVETVSVLDFCRHAKQLLAVDQTDFVRFALTGRYADGQACIDPILNRLSDEEDLNVARDYDSLLGICKHILVHRYLTVYPVARKEDTLSANIHIQYEFTTADGTFTEDVHRIPNLCLAKWDVHNMIRVLIPGLYDRANPSPYPSQLHQKIFYEQGFLPAMQELYEDISAEWPATYEDEMFRARGRNGGLSFQTKTVPSWNIRNVGKAIRSHLRRADIPWAKGIVFLHQIRGVKHSTYHSLTPRAAHESLLDFLGSAALRYPEVTSFGKWWVDVGIEVRSKSRKCLAWRTDSHVHMVQHVCEISDRNAQRITSIGSSKYTRDLTSHLAEVSGCRICPGARGQGPFEVAYVQMYCTDKALTYRQDQGHHGKFIACNDVLKGKADHFINNLYALYLNAIDDKPSYARMELRVPLTHARDVFINLDEDIVRNSLVSFHGVEWWSLRAYRAKAIQLILDWQAEGDPLHRAKWSSLLLTAGCVWMLNGLHSAPENGSSHRELMSAILPHVERQGADPMILAYGTATDEDGDDDMTDTLPAYPWGLAFFRSLRVGPRFPVPRLDNIGVKLSNRTFRFLFGVSYDDVGTEFFRAGLERPFNPRRTHNKARRTARYVHEGDGPQPMLFNLEARGVRLPPPPHDGGSDVEGEEEEDRISGDEDNADQALTTLWLQFILDITAKCSNRQGSTQNGYCKLSEEERGVATEALYKNPRLSDFFNDCQWKQASETEWENVFKKFFPEAGQLNGKTQNYKSCRYYMMWAKIRARAGDEGNAQRLLKAIKSRFDKLSWVPYAQCDRIWATKPVTRLKKFLNHGTAAPWVLVKPGITPRWIFE